jgi:hypothetical protein
MIRSDKRKKLVLFKEKKEIEEEKQPKRQRSNSQMSIKSNVSNTTIITRKTIWTDMISEKTNKKNEENVMSKRTENNIERKNLSVDSAFMKKRKGSEEKINALENITEVF